MFGFLCKLESDPDFTNRLKEDRKYLSKGTNRKLHTRNQEKLDDLSDNPLGPTKNGRTKNGRRKLADTKTDGYDS